VHRLVFFALMFHHHSPLTADNPAASSKRVGADVLSLLVPIVLSAASTIEAERHLTFSAEMWQ
jgi:hypothetical protein